MLLATLNSYTQSSFPEGIYLNIEQLRNRTPALNVPIQIIPKSKSKYKTSNYYKLHSSNDSIDERYTKSKILALSQGDTLLINNISGTNYPFSKALTNGNFIVFPSNIKKSDPGLIIATVMFGTIGYAAHTALTSDSNDNTVQKSKWQILSLRTGNFRSFTKEYLAERVKEYPDLLQKFKKEKRRMPLEVMLDYVNLLNERTAIR